MWWPLSFCIADCDSTSELKVVGWNRCIACFDSLVSTCQNLWKSVKHLLWSNPKRVCELVTHNFATVWGTYKWEGLGNAKWKQPFRKTCFLQPWEFCHSQTHSYVLLLKDSNFEKTMRWHSIAQNVPGVNYTVPTKVCIHPILRLERVHCWLEVSFISQTVCQDCWQEKFRRICHHSSRAPFCIDLNQFYNFCQIGECKVSSGECPGGLQAETCLRHWDPDCSYQGMKYLFMVTTEDRDSRLITLNRLEQWWCRCGRGQQGVNQRRKSPTIHYITIPFMRAN